uniref:Large ribosomal subunit protein uL23c n=1 Tax=Centroceras clavulatum TaxID=159503 RepID=A0A4D6WSC2_9FLOR|nr:ribosomal protein L23 [Centroceras clavulatum]
MKKKNNYLTDLIKYPIITDKTTQYIEDNKYCFAVDCKANKFHIKQAIEYIFDVKVVQVNTLNITPKNKRIGRFIGKKTRYKKAILTLDSQYTINLFTDN